MNESIVTMAALLDAYPGRRTRTGWVFRSGSSTYRVSHEPGASWVVEVTQRPRQRHTMTFGTEGHAAHYLAYMLDPPPPNPRIRPVDELVNREQRYVLGLDLESGRHYAAFPVTIGVADYSEYYAVTDEHYSRLLADPDAALAFVEECRRREHDDLLMQQPGWNRGIPG